jgi:hypothetical protein
MRERRERDGYREEEEGERNDALRCHQRRRCTTKEEEEKKLHSSPWGRESERDAAKREGKRGGRVKFPFFSSSFPLEGYSISRINGRREGERGRGRDERGKTEMSPAQSLPQPVFVSEISRRLPTVRGGRLRLRRRRRRWRRRGDGRKPTPRRRSPWDVAGRRRHRPNVVGRRAQVSAVTRAA